MINRVLKLRQKVKEEKPLIHCITNPISINDCANAVLAVGAKPIMAEHPREVEQITAGAKALCVNLGNITDARMESMLLSGKTAKRLGIPSCIDLVGVACSSLRLEFAKTYLRDCCPKVIKGNLSEIKAFCGVPVHAAGIDAGDGDRLEEDSITAAAELLSGLSRTTNAVVFATGAVDLVAKADKVYWIKNGTPMLAEITGTGCMLNVLTGSFLSKGQPAEAALLAAMLMGIAGETADTSKGIGSYHISLLDQFYMLDDAEIRKRARIGEIA